MGALTTAAILGVGLGFGVSKITSKGGGQQMASPVPLPQPPSAVAAAEKGADAVRKKMASMTRSIYTSPLGIAGEAQVARKTLLGQ